MVVERDKETMALRSLERMGKDEEEIAAGAWSEELPQSCLHHTVHKIECHPKLDTQ